MGDSTIHFHEKGNVLPILIECRSSKIGDAIDGHKSRINVREFRRNEMQKEGKSDDYIDRKLLPVPHPIIIAISEELKGYGFPYAENFTYNLLKKTA